VKQRRIIEELGPQPTVVETLTNIVLLTLRSVYNKNITTATAAATATTTTIIIPLIIIIIIIIKALIKYRSYLPILHLGNVISKRRTFGVFLTAALQTIYMLFYFNKRCI